MTHNANSIFGEVRKAVQEGGALVSGWNESEAATHYVNAHVERNGVTLSAASMRDLMWESERVEVRSGAVVLASFEGESLNSLRNMVACRVLSYLAETFLDTSDRLVQRALRARYRLATGAVSEVEAQEEIKPLYDYAVGAINDLDWIEYGVMAQIASRHTGDRAACHTIAAAHVHFGYLAQATGGDFLDARDKAQADLFERTVDQIVADALRDNGFGA